MGRDHLPFWTSLFNHGRTELIYTDRIAEPGGALLSNAEYAEARTNDE
jgi:hypothetical protein